MKASLHFVLNICIAVLLGFCSPAIAQQTEYRITDDGRYQYLSNRQEAGMVFDESLGSYYKDITVRTFFLETQRKGYIPHYYTFEGFVKLTLPEQQRLLKQPYKEQDCSSGNATAGCMEYKNNPPSNVPRQAGTTVIDLSPKCTDNSNSPQSKMTITNQLIVHPNNTAVQNNNCGAAQPAMQTDRAKTVSLILIND